MQEQWSRWEPVLGLDGRYDVDTILDTDDGRGLIITLYSYKNNNQKVEVIFDRPPESYRHTNESFIIELPYDLSKRYGKGFYADWNFFKIANSRYLAGLACVSHEHFKASDFSHFCIFCPDSVLDIIACYEPVVRIISPLVEE